MKRLVEFVSCSSLSGMKSFILLGSKIEIITRHAVFSADWSRDYLPDIKNTKKSIYYIWLMKSWLRDYKKCLCDLDVSIVKISSNDTSPLPSFLCRNVDANQFMERPFHKIPLN